MAVHGAFRGYFPEGKLRERSDVLLDQFDGDERVVAVASLGLNDRVFKSLANERRLDLDPLIDLVAALDDLDEGEFGAVQVLFSAAREPWRSELEEFVESIDDVDHVSTLIRAKFAEPLFAVCVRVLALAASADRASEIIGSVACALHDVTRSETNELVPADALPTSDDDLADVLDRASHRSGMLLSLSELLTLVHPPSASIRLSTFVRQSGRTKPVPARFTRGDLLLGTNLHDGDEREVWLGTEDRLRHTYVIGASGTGKSTLLLSMAVQDIEEGNGVAVFDPHGDLIEDILARIPDDRVHDVVLVDPADEDYSVGFNILSAHSSLERTLLASDLVATFRRFTTTFGDQMVSVLGNAILAILESSRGGTLVDLRHFLLEDAFRKEYLKTVEDEEVVRYWKREFPLLKGNPQASVLTRLNAFLRPKLVRYMVGQQNAHLNVRAIMDGRQILLVKLAQGAIGEENAHLLGTLFVAKLAQAAMSRQEVKAADRVPFFVYIDEFHHFVTPSIATILSGARKYGLGLTLAHQELRQVKSRSEDVLSALIGNAHTRVVFRVGDHDARALADGFTAFEARDLQRLGIGEAIARIERSDFDFNLATTEPTKVDEELASHRTAAVIQASRETYATPRSQVEEELRSRDVHQGDADVERPTGRRRAAEAVSDGDNKPAPPAPASAPGRGGTEHKYLQEFVRKLAEDRGFTVSLEREVLSGHGYVDAVLERDALTIGVEISVSTRPEHEAANLVKCLAAGFDFAVLLSTDQKRLEIARSLLGDTSDARLRLLRPTELAAFLDQVQGRAKVPTSSPKVRSERTERVRLPAADAAPYLGLAVQTLAKFRVTGESPPYIKVGRSVFYEKVELDKWLDERRRRSTSDSGRQNEQRRRRRR
ncbi:MAG: type IV secretion system DNA-binding domain-containing protein [Acidobacteria bacterium]|nr:type IV secretion system DNA-binding domain-containing protein [Acidobacteriota bacterium]